MTAHLRKAWAQRIASGRRAESREVGLALRRAGFKASTSSGSRIRGAPYINPGYTAQSYIPLDEYERAEFGGARQVVKVHWVQKSGIRHDFDKDEESRQITAMAEALRAAGFEIQDRGNHIVVLSRND